MIGANLELNQILRAILEQLKNILVYDTASILLLGEGNRSDLMIGIGYSDEQTTSREAQQLLRSSPILHQMSIDLKPVICADVHEQPGWIWVPGTEKICSWMGIPLTLRGRMTAVLMVDHPQIGFFGEKELQIAQVLTQHAVAAIENARLYEDAIMAAERRSVLHRASQEIAQASLDPESVYLAVHQAASQLMPAEAFVISLLDEQQQEAVGVYLVDKGERSQVDRVPVGEGLSGLVISTGKPIITNDFSTEPIPGTIHFGEEEGDEVRSILAVPIRLGKKVIGMLSAQSYQPYAYSDDDQALLEMLAAHAAVAIENARLYGETMQRLKELEAVNHISTTLRAAKTVDEMLPNLLDETLQVLGCEAGVISIYEPANGVLMDKVARGWFKSLEEIPLHPGEGIGGTVFKNGQVILVKEFTKATLTYNGSRQQVPDGWGGACIPIRTMQEVIGVLFVSVRLPRQLQAAEIHLLTTLCEIAGNALRRADLHEQTERQLQRLASLRTIDMAISTILDLRVTLGILIDHILSQLKVDAVDILLINPTTQTLYHAASSGFRSDEVKSSQLYINDGLALPTIRNRAVQFIQNLSDHEFFSRKQYLAGEGFVTYFGVPLIAKGQVKGILETYYRHRENPDRDWLGFLETLAGQTAIAIDNSLLFEELQQTNLDLSAAYDATIEGWSKALDMRDRETEGHTLRVTQMTLQLAEEIGISVNDMIHIRRGSLLHDIGKMGVPDSILNKAGPLQEEEWNVMHRHPEFAYAMLSPISYLRLALDIPYCHHEHWNGSGYPRGLKGEQIPLAARVFTVVDVYDALISKRPYREGWNGKAAMDFIRKNSRHSLRSESCGYFRGNAREKQTKARPNDPLVLLQFDLQHTPGL